MNSQRARFMWCSTILAVFGLTLLSTPVETSLRQLAERRNVLVGAAADAAEFGRPDPLNEESYARTLATEYNMLEPANVMKWATVHPAQGIYNFQAADRLVAFAEKHSMKVRGHNLCWSIYNPGWLAKLSSADLNQALREHIWTVVSHFRGRVFAWDVVNEAVSDGATGKGIELADSIWYNRPGIGLPGTGYIEQAFWWAHEADPNALLFYNDYGIEAPGPKFQAVYNMLADFISRGIPVNGVGFQMHIDTGGYPSEAGLGENIAKIARLGLQVHITEMDVRLKINKDGVASESDLQLQAGRYREIALTCLRNPACTAFQTWGFSDQHSWVPSFYTGFGAALPFDAAYQPKPAFWAIYDAFE